MASSDALPVPRKNVAYRLYFEIRKNDGTLITGATGADSEISKDGGTFADCTNEITEIATSSGVYYLDLTSTEMNADSVVVKTTVTNTSALPTILALYPQEADDIRVNTTYWNDGAIPAVNVTGEPLVDVNHWRGTQPNALQSGRLDSYIGAIASGVIAAASFASGALDAVWSTSSRTLTGFGTLVSDIWSNATRTLSAFGFGVNVTQVNSNNVTSPDDFKADVSGLSTFDNTSDQVIVATNNDKTGYSLSSGGIQAVWDALTSALSTSGSIGKLLVDNINAAITSRLASASYTAPDNASITAIKAKTDNLPSDPADESLLETAINAVVSQINNLNDLSAAEINAEVRDVLTVDTFTELTDVPNATVTLTDAILWLYLLARNKRTQSATTQTVLADDGTTPVATSGVSDNGTVFTAGEWS